MKRAPKLPKVYSSTIDATKAATFYDRLHALKDAIEALQAQYTEDMAEVYEEASEALNADPTCLRMAFTEERQKRKREARIARMDAGKAHQLDLLGDVAAGSDALAGGHDLNPKLVEKIAQAVQTKAGTAALLSAVDTMIDRETGEILEESQAKTVADAPANATTQSAAGEETVSRGADARSSAETAEIYGRDSTERRAPSSPKPSYDVIAEIPSFLLREQPPKPPPPPAA